MKNSRSIVDLIGNTPLIEIRNMKSRSRIFLKMEGMNPGGSVKDRIALSMIDDAEERGVLKPGGTVIEATSGNTGIGLAMVCASKGYRCILYMPEGMSVERRRILQLRGASLELVAKAEGPGMTGSTRLAKEASEKNGYFYVDQFNNPSNPKAHTMHTGPEIVRDFKELGVEPDYFVCGIGTGGTITGAGPVLKAAFPKCKVIGVEPKGSHVLNGGKAGPHRIQGIGAGFVPGVLNLNHVDEVMQVVDEDAFAVEKELSAKEGLFAGISGGAAVSIALKIAEANGEAKNIVVIVPDVGDRYLSVL